MKHIHDTDELREYLNATGSEKLFNCPHLRIASEPIKTSKPGELYPPDKGEYEKGALICLCRLGCSVSYRCNIAGDLKPTEEGGLEATCSFNSSTFRFELTDFIPGRILK